MMEKMITVEVDRSLRRKNAKLTRLIQEEKRKGRIWSFSLVLVIIAAMFLLNSYYQMVEKEELAQTQIRNLQQQNSELQTNLDDSIAMNNHLQEENNILQEKVKQQQKEEEQRAEDVKLLSQIIFKEEGGSSDEAQLSCGNVIYNRIDSSFFPNTLEDVVFQDGQYEPTFDMEKFWKGEPSERVIKNAELLVDGLRILPPNVIWQAEFPQGDGLYKQIGRSMYCYSYTNDT